MLWFLLRLQRIWTEEMNTTYFASSILICSSSALKEPSVSPYDKTIQNTNRLQLRTVYYNLFAQT